MSTVHETCACGARFDYISRDSWTADVDCRRAAQAWREHHRHEMATPTEPTAELELEADAPTTVWEVESWRRNM